MAAKTKEEDSPFKPQAAAKALREQVAELDPAVVIESVPKLREQVAELDIEKQVELARAVRVACREISSDELLAMQIVLEVSKVL